MWVCLFLGVPPSWQGTSTKMAHPYGSHSGLMLSVSLACARCAPSMLQVSAKSGGVDGWSIAASSYVEVSAKTTGRYAQKAAAPYEVVG